MISTFLVRLMGCCTHPSFCYWSVCVRAAPAHAQLAGTHRPWCWGVLLVVKHSIVRYSTTTTASLTQNTPTTGTSPHPSHPLYTTKPHMYSVIHGK